MFQIFVREGTVGHGKGKEKSPVNYEDSESDQDTVLKDIQGFSDSSESENEAVVSHVPSRRRWQMPARYRSDSDSDNDGVLCDICQLNERLSLSSEIVFWVDCYKCGKWVHNVGLNTTTRKDQCRSCS